MLQIEDVRHAFNKFDGQNLYTNFEDFYSDYSEFLLPLLAFLEEGKNGMWNPDERRWS